MTNMVNASWAVLEAALPYPLESITDIPPAANDNAAVGQPFNLKDCHGGIQVTATLCGLLH